MYWLVLYHVSFTINTSILFIGYAAIDIVSVRDSSIADSATVLAVKFAAM